MFAYNVNAMFIFLSTNQARYQEQQWLVNVDAFFPPDLQYARSTLSLICNMNLLQFLKFTPLLAESLFHP